MVSFDWYQATVPAALDDVLEACMGLGERVGLHHLEGRHGFGHRTRLELPDGDLLGEVWHGGRQVHPHVQFTGDQAVEGSRCIRAAFPSHLVTRADPRVDFIDPTAYDRMQTQLIEVAKDFRLRAGTAGDHLVRQEGRTFPLGSPKSPVQAKIYEKTAEQRAKLFHDPARLAMVPENWARFEARIRPQTREAKLLFASIEPVAAMGSSRWLREAWRRVMGQGVEPVHVGKVWRPTDDDRAYSTMLFQYGGLLARRQLDHGSWPAFGQQIGYDLAERDRIKRRSGRIRG